MRPRVLVTGGDCSGGPTLAQAAPARPSSPQVALDCREHAVQVCGLQAAGEGVLLRGMEGAEQAQVAAEVVLDAMAERQAAARWQAALAAEHRGEPVESD